METIKNLKFDLIYLKNMQVVIDRLAELKEKIEATEDVKPIDEAISILYDILEGAGE